MFFFPFIKVIICTDGLSNVGVGSLEEGVEKGAPFYEQIGKFAKSNETSINVISIEVLFIYSTLRAKLTKISILGQ